MKKTIFLIILTLLAYSGAYAQGDSVRVWNKWCARKDTMLLFTTANNVIQIYSPTLKPAEIKVKSLDRITLRLGKTEVKGDTTSVMAMPYPGKGKLKNMRLAIMYKKSGRLIKTVNFTSDNVPPLMAHLGKLQGNEATKKDIMAQTVITASFPDSYYSYPYRIKQFSFKMNWAKGGINTNVNGIFITGDILRAIKDAPEGTIAEFTNIIATCPECDVRKLDDLKIKIR